MWSKLSIENRSTHFWKVANKIIYIRKRNKEWLYSINDTDTYMNVIDYGVQNNEEIDADWLTVVGDKSSALNILPALPDRPIVVKPETTLKILPGKNVLVFIRVPIWLQFYAGTKKKENLVFECSSKELSSTWFGEPDSGTLAYSLRLKPDAQLFEKPKSFTNHIICPIRLTNDSNMPLDVQRLLLHGEYLNIYGERNELYTNEVKIKFKGISEISDVQYSNQAPSYSKHSCQISSARSSKTKNVITKSFHYIKSLTNY